VWLASQFGNCDDPVLRVDAPPSGGREAAKKKRQQCGWHRSLETATIRYCGLMHLLQEDGRQQGKKDNSVVGPAARDPKDETHPK